MATETTYLQLIKPDLDDDISPTPLNTNFDIIDQQLHELFLYKNIIIDTNTLIDDHLVPDIRVLQNATTLQDANRYTDQTFGDIGSIQVPSASGAGSSSGGSSSGSGSGGGTSSGGSSSGGSSSGGSSSGSGSGGGTSSGGTSSDTTSNTNELCRFEAAELLGYTRCAPLGILDTIDIEAEEGDELLFVFVFDHGTVDYYRPDIEPIYSADNVGELYLSVRVFRKTAVDGTNSMYVYARGENCVRNAIALRFPSDTEIVSCERLTTYNLNSASQNYCNGISTPYRVLFWTRSKDNNNNDRSITYETTSDGTLITNEVPTLTPGLLHAYVANDKNKISIFMNAPFTTDDYNNAMFGVGVRKKLNTTGFQDSYRQTVNVEPGYDLKVINDEDSSKLEVRTTWATTSGEAVNRVEEGDSTTVYDLFSTKFDGTSWNIKTTSKLLVLKKRLTSSATLDYTSASLSDGSKPKNSIYEPVIVDTPLVDSGSIFEITEAMVDYRLLPIIGVYRFVGSGTSKDDFILTITNILTGEVDEFVYSERAENTSLYKKYPTFVVKYNDISTWYSGNIRIALTTEYRKEHNGYYYYSLYATDNITNETFDSSDFVWMANDSKFPSNIDITIYTYYDK